ncbi:unnamed protein product [Nezara viridula]|uniref:Uncharacterized protein n=1 Tax=Nezara viridula TaxID=85310 RepID=A0A9P0EGZ7_NEZVI|nr:unnamed protein product [Nezara viridula]
MESKAARIQQWLRDLRLPSLRSWSNIDVSSVSSQDHLEELELNPKTFEDIATPWNTDQDSIKKWKSSQNLSLVTHDKESHNEWFKIHSSQEEIRDDCTSEESIPSSPTPSTHSLHEIYHLQHYFKRTLKLKPTQPNSPRHRNRLSVSDPDFRFYEVNSYQQDTSWAPQSSSSIEILNTVHSCSKKNVSFHRTSSSRKTYIQEKYPKLKLKNSLRFRQFPIARPKVVETQHHSLKRRLPYPPQSGKDHSLSPPPLVTKVNYQGTESYLSQKSTQSVDLGYDSLPTYDMYHSTHSSVRGKARGNPLLASDTTSPNITIWTADKGTPADQDMANRSRLLIIDVLVAPLPASSPPEQDPSHANDDKAIFTL